MTIIERPPTPVPLLFGADSINDIVVGKAEVLSDTLERVELSGGVLLGRDLSIEADDLVDVAGALHRLADRIMDATFEARDIKLDAERHDCFCGTRLEPDEVTCGAQFCNRQAAAEAWADANSERF